MTLTAGRPSWHPTAPRGWMSDPNGVTWRDGRWHVFYQHNPASPRWGLMHWGHLTSTDLVRWRDEGVALAPTPGSADGDGCWSGCVRDIEGEPVAFYTGATGSGSAHAQAVLRAVGDDALTRFHADPGSALDPDPVTAGTAHQRDPFLLQDDEGWTMLLGTGRPGRGGAVVAWRSSDAKSWTYAGEVFSLARGSRGIDTGPVWECPQLVRLGDDWLLVVSVQLPGQPDPLCPYALWFLGDFDGVRFTERASGVVDGGDVLYAPALAVAPDGRILMWGWIQESAETRSSPARTWAGAMSLPREVTIVDDRVVIRPARELADMWGRDTIRFAALDVTRALRRLPSPAAPEFRVVLESPPAAVEIVLGTDGEGRRVRIPVRRDAAGFRVSIELVDADDAIVSLGESRVPEPRRVEVVVDHSVLEVFCGGASITARIDPVLTADVGVVSGGDTNAVVDIAVSAASGVRLDRPRQDSHH